MTTLYYLIPLLFATLYICFAAAGHSFKVFAIYATAIISGLGFVWLLVQ